MTLKEKIIIGLCAVAFAIGIGWAAKFYSDTAVETFATKLKNDWTIENQALLDNLAVLRSKNHELTSKLNSARNQLSIVRNQKVKEFEIVKKSKDPELLAEYFDKTVDEYSPELVIMDVK